MPNKIKIALTLVAIVAVFSVYQLAQYIHRAANSGPVPAFISDNNQDAVTCPTCDPDHDGLTNAEEIMWGADPLNPDSDSDGFKDGEEVKSGHSPLVPGPNDLISADNLTKQLSDLTVDGLAEGSLQSDNPNYYKSLADITSSVADSAKYIFSKEIDDSILSTTNTSNQTDITYLKSISPLLKSFSDLLASQYQHIADNLNTIGKTGFVDPAISSYFSGQASRYQDIVDKGSAIVVPQNLKIADAKFLSLALQMHAICDAVAHGSEDPIKASYALDSLGDMYDQYINLLGMYKTTLEEMTFTVAELDIINNLSQ